MGKLLDEMSRGRLALLAPLAFAACSGGSSDDDAPPPPPPPVTVVTLDAADPCAADVPTPTDLFTNDDGTTERAACPLPSDPLEAAMADIVRNMGAPTDAEIQIPIDGSLDALSLSSTVSFALQGTATGGPPPLVMIAQTGSATSAAGWTVVNTDIRFVDPDIVVRPRGMLAEGVYHVVVSTNAIKNAESPSRPVQTNALVALLTGTETVEAGAVEGLDAATAARLERERLRLAPALDVLEAASPPIPRDRITSVQGFTTDPGYGRFERLVELYFEAIDDGVYDFGATNASVPREDVFLGTPADYPNVSEVHYGTIRAPRLLGDDGRTRPNWHLDAEEIEIPFAFSVPVGEARYKTILFAPGYGRGRIDIRSLAQEAAEVAAAAVMAIDMRCHGARSPGVDGVCVENRTEAEVDALQDALPNNGNMQVQGADGIPDDSGLGWFPGDVVALRDSQMAAAIELIHVISTLRDAGNFTGLNPNPGQIHLVAQGHIAPAAVLALAETNYPTTNLTAAFPAGGADYRELIEEGPAPLESAWKESLPHGLTDANSSAYLDLAEQTVFKAIDLDIAGPLAAQKLTNGSTVRRALLPHGAIPQYVSTAARSALIGAVGIPTNRVSGHRAQCDDFFLFPCRLGDNPVYMEEARRQLVVFVNSAGNTVTSPGQ